jgi:hypothetical protein
VKTLRIDELEPIPVVDGKLDWRPIRRTLGIEAFGINAYTATSGHLVVEEHDETGAGAGHQEELYVVITGRATFTVNGESFDAPVGTTSFSTTRSSCGRRERSTTARPCSRSAERGARAAATRRSII